MFSLEAPAELEGRRRLRFTEVERLGDDLRLMARF
jgi:diaminohydroxyphosphoribosylaminopyrimidine deaminase/5-amino-6-(5-phosphoribosylamino)uracil reductase